MNEGEFARFQAHSGKLYADELVATGNFTLEEAQRRAEAEGARLLPDGLQTPNAMLLSVIKDESPVGYLWFQLKSNGKSAFSYAFEMDESAKGYGYFAMKKARAYLRSRGVESLSLNVFNRNERAVELYRKVGFQVVSYNMSVEL
jgi:ribosomal protein S18 acetylase RimI-like enzyme